MQILQTIWAEHSAEILTVLGAILVDVFLGWTNNNKCKWPGIILSILRFVGNKAGEAQDR